MLGLGAVLLVAAPTRAERVTYTYDVFGEVKSATLNTGGVVTYAYDAAGNRTQLGVGGSNQGPTAGADILSVTINTPKTFDPRTNDADPEGDPLTITAKTNGAHGTVTINGGTTLTYTPTTGYTGADSFTYTVSDSLNATAVGTVSVIVAGNSAPDAVNDAEDATTNSYDSVALTVFVLNNDTDPNGDTLTITGVSTPTNSATAVIQNGNRIYVSGIVIGGTSFAYTISDGHGGSDTDTVTITRDAPTDCGQYNTC